MAKSGRLNKFVEDKAREIPRAFLRKLIKKKLLENSIDDHAMLDALTDHILSNKGGDFIWNEDSDDPDRSIKIEFTEKDGDDLVKDVLGFIENDFPKVITKSVDHGAKLIVRNLQKRWAAIRIEERNDMQRFRDRLELRWAAGLDPLRMMIGGAREVGESFAERLSKSKTRKNLHKRQVLSVLHIRACQTAAEIVTLLENGFADGAYARWRTLYEISVVALVVDRFGDEVARRYLAHDTVSMREYIKNEYQHSGREYDPESLRGYDREIEEEFQVAVAEFGKPFAGPYGWAAAALQSKSPKFQDLEKAVDWKALSPDYKLSSYKVHAGVAGTIRSIAGLGGEDSIFGGATNAGLERAAANTAYSLLHVTSLVFHKVSDMETQMNMKAMVLLRDTVRRECFRIAKALEKDEMELQRFEHEQLS